jgi:hypothetical protein
MLPLALTIGDAELEAYIHKNAVQGHKLDEIAFVCVHYNYLSTSIGPLSDAGYTQIGFCIDADDITRKIYMYVKCADLIKIIQEFMRSAVK